MTHDPSQHEAGETRAIAALTGLALGDALGMPAQTLSRNDIRSHYGRIEGFVAPFDEHPVSHGLKACQVTDDTEQTLLLAERLIGDPDGFDDAGWARDLLDWEAGIKAKGLSDLLGPSSRAAIDALLSGASPLETGRKGTTNGAAMRIAPVGIMVPATPERLVAKVFNTCRVTHNTGEAIAAASAVAMVVSCGIEGRPFDRCLDPALSAARLGQTFGNEIGERDMAGRIETALKLAENGTEEDLVSRIGSSVASRESIPMAFGLLRLHENAPWDALLAAANIGDDTDTIAAIVGAMAGATGWQPPRGFVDLLNSANNLDLAEPARRLVALRGREAVKD